MVWWGWNWSRWPGVGWGTQPHTSPTQFPAGPASLIDVGIHAYVHDVRRSRQTRSISRSLRPKPQTRPAWRLFGRRRGTRACGSDFFVGIVGCNDCQIQGVGVDSTRPGVDRPSARLTLRSGPTQPPSQPPTLAHQSTPPSFPPPPFNRPRHHRCTFRFNRSIHPVVQPHFPKKINDICMMCVTALGLACGRPPPTPGLALAPLAAADAAVAAGHRYGVGFRLGAVFDWPIEASVADAKCLGRPPPSSTSTS